MDVPYQGWSVAADNAKQDLRKVKGADSYVVKVDQAVKKRFKNGLVLLDVKKKDLPAAITQLQDKGYNSFIVEPFVAHAGGTERYLSLSHGRDGHTLALSSTGGVDIEDNSGSIETFAIDAETDWKKLAEKAALGVEQLQALVETFKRNHFVFLEINPYVVDGDAVNLLDCAVEVDDAASYFVSDWTESDIRAPKRSSKEELAIQALDANSPASFMLEIINPDGAVFLLLSGGGASVVIADEVYNQGFGEHLANYGEYSGNPNTHETYLYTSEVLNLLVKSKAPKKVAFIGGAVANFTDIANTFAGVVAAIEERAEELAKQEVKFFVRRGGPRQEIGLAKIRQALIKHNLLGDVYDPSTTLTDALGTALKGLEA